MTILLKTKIKWPINVKLSAIDHIYQHPFEKKSLDNILLDAYECITTKKMVKNTILIFDYSWLTKGERQRQYRVNNLKWGKVKAYYAYTTLNIHNLVNALCRKLPDICSSCFGWQNREIETVK